MTETEKLKQALDAAGVAWRGGEPLAAHCTFRIGGPAAVFVQPASHGQICKAILLCRETGVRYFLLGNGSNVLFSDAGFSGAVIDLSQSAGEAELLPDGRVCAGAGLMLSRLCTAARDAGLSGLEFAYGIPGTVGGAVYMNAGAYGGEIKDVLTRVEVLTADGRVETREASQLELSYRHSVFEHSGECILRAYFQLHPADPAAIHAAMEELMGRRRAKQPLEYPSAGSTFKRPAGAFAGALIEQCGLRGFRVGGAAVSEKHCGFVVNLGGASCADVLELCGTVSRIVYEKTGYRLEKEVRVVE